MAERDLEIDVMKEVAGKSGECVRSGRQIAYVRRRGISFRRACALLQVARSTVGYESALAKRDASVIEAMRELAAQYPRFGYRRIRVFLAGRGLTMSADRAYRIWKKAGLQVPCRRPRRRVATGRPRPLPVTSGIQAWAYDVVFDRSANGQQLKCLTVIDEFTRECLAVDAAGSIRSRRVIELLSQLVSVRGAPRYLRSDNGPEFVSREMLQWLLQARIETAPIDPGKSWQNGSNESFNGKFRDECLGRQWFKNRIDAKVAIDSWRRLYKEVRAHSSLRNLTPAEYARRSSTTSPEQAVF